MREKRVKYFSPKRPLTPGTYPRRPDLNVLGITNFDEPLPIKGCDVPVWGWIEYDKHLTEKEIDQYELIPRFRSKITESRENAWRNYRKKTKQINIEFNMEKPEERAAYERVKKLGPKTYIRRLILDDMARNPKPDSE